MCETNKNSHQDLNYNYGAVPRTDETNGGDGQDDDDNDDDIVELMGDSSRPPALFLNPYFRCGVIIVILALVLFVFDKEKKKHNHKEWQIPLFYEDQLVDHFAKNPENSGTWVNRYYVGSEHFQGPGSPLFVILGGEDAVDEVLYPFVMDELAPLFGAYVLQLEHRFYGVSIPTNDSSSELRRLLRPDQALADFARLTSHIRDEIGCSKDRTSSEYCPVVAVGASYPGFLSAMFRFAYPEIVDMSYASSAPLKLYDQSMDQYVYFDYVTKVAEEASPGCAHAYKSTLMNVKEMLKEMSVQDGADALGICPDKIPHYMINTSDIFANEITMLVGFSNADFNMDYHPPGDNSTDVIKACHVFQQHEKTPLERLADFLVVKAESGATDHPGEPCYDLHWDIPSGKHARITGADWSGMGDGDTARTWEFQCCRDLIIRTGFGPDSMFLDRSFDLDWLTDHCQARFGVSPEPFRMVDRWHFDDLVGAGASHILFVNGLKDAWSPLSYLEDLSDTILALNLPSGAHHSDLNHVPNHLSCGTEPGQECDDILQGRVKIASILGEWIEQVKKMAKDDD